MSFGTKLLEMFRNLKSDAVPKPPRPENVYVNNDEQYEQTDENIPNTTFEGVPEEVEEPDLKKGNEKPKKEGKKPSNKNEKKKNFFGIPKSGKENNYDRQNSNSNVNTQATGNVVNIVGSTGIRLGNEIVYYLGPTTVSPKNQTEGPPEEEVEKCNLITLLMESTIKPDHDYIDYVSRNLGKQWISFFRKLGFTQGRIESAEYDHSKLGVSEVRYKLLLEWTNNDEKATLGNLSTLLWEEGERRIVKELAIIYKSRK